MPDLDRFKTAQEMPHSGFDTALRELRAGRKRSHWIWYIFPQLEGLGRSSMAVRYGLAGLPEATAYLRDPVLRGRLLAVVQAVFDHLELDSPPPVDALMGSEIDALKLVSSMTLFRHVARSLNATEPLPEYADLADRAERILAEAARQGWPECRFTAASCRAAGGE